MDAISRIVAHLRGRPMARIFEQCHEKNNIIALKLMCILDAELERLNLYSEIQASNPKLLGLLLRTTSFATFKYYDYVVKKEIGRRILRCKFCDLVGGYACILSHMAMSHNTNVGMKVCAYCNRCELEKHFAENTLDQCYQRYLQQNEWHDYECNANVLDIVAKFFAMLKRLSKKFDVYSIRQKKYTGVGYKSVEKLKGNYGDDFPTECMVFKQQNRKNFKELSKSHGLDIEFQRAMNYLYGQSSNDRSAQREKTNRAVIIRDQAENIPMEQLQSLFNRPGSQFHLDATTKIEPSMSMPVETILSTSYDQQQQLPENEPQAPFVLCSTSTHQLDDDGPLDNFQSTPNVSSSNIPFGSPHLSNQDGCFEPNTSVANLGSVYDQLAVDAVQFGLFVAQRLTKLPDERSRRKLEHSIQAVILDIERESFQ